MSNATVLELVGGKPLSKSVLANQLTTFGRAARAPPSSDMFQAAFGDNLLRSPAAQFVRKIGRPQLEWTTEVRKVALQIAGSIDRLREMVEDSAAWRHAVHEFVT